MAPPVVTLARDLGAVIRAGHPWVFDRALRPGSRLPEGELVIVADRGGPLALGFADPRSPIAVRILSLDPGEAIDDAWVAERARRAAECRAADPLLAGTDAIRLCHGENDYVPGLVVDLYDTTAVAVFDGPAAAAFWRPRLEAVVAGLRAGGAVIERVWGRGGGGCGPGPVLFCDEPPPAIVIAEDGARFEVDVRRGQKTGFFLDQRDNRRLVRALSAGATMLNLFAYTGGFSVHAALGGARRVTTVDLARPAIEAAARNFTLSGLDPAGHVFEAADAFEYLERAASRGDRFDVVVVDPPSFAPSERAKGKALGAYRRINTLALGVVAPGGVLCSASCSSHVTVDELLAAIAAAGAAAARRVRIRQVLGAASDHPVAPGFPEGRYLKCVVGYVE
jgi:23S rRNA (cytosine1962-C5)-methyltransferase